MMTCFLLVLLAAGELSAQTAPGHPLWDVDQVHTVKLTFEPVDWYQQLRRNFEGKADPDYMEVDVMIGDLAFPKSGIRFKGNSSYNTYPGQKKSFKIKFDKYDKKQEFDGIGTINLNNAFKDPSFVREKMYYELAAQMGLAAPRVNYAAVYINEKYWGLYFLTEQVDKRLIQGRFGEEEDGNLFKGDPRGTLEYRGEDKTPYKTMYELETNEKADDWTDLIRLSRVLNQTPVAELPGALEPLLDVEGVMSLLALDNYTVNLDSYLGSGHNYYLYHRMADDRFTPVPWDPNEAWGGFNLGMGVTQLTRLPLLYPMGVAVGPGLPPQPPPPGGPGAPGGPIQMGGGARPLATRLYSVADYRTRFVAKLKGLAEGVGHPDVVVPRMNVLRDMIRPYVLDDTQKMFTNAQFENAMTVDLGGGPVGPPQPGAPPQPGGLPGGGVPGLETFLRARYEFVRAQ